MKKVLQKQLLVIIVLLGVFVAGIIGYRKMHRQSQPNLLVWKTKAHKGRVDIAFLAHGKGLATMGYDVGGKKEVVKIWDVKNGTLLNEFAPLQLWTNLCLPSGCPATTSWRWVFSPNGSYLALTIKRRSRNQLTKAVGIWDVLKAQFLSGWQKGLGVYDFADATFSSNEQILMTVDNDGTIRLWDVPNRKVFFTLNLGTKECILSHDGGKLAAIVKPKIIQILWTKSGKTLRVVRHPSAEFLRLIAFAPDDSWIATGDSDGHIRLWRLSDGSLIYTLPYGVLSPDGQFLTTIQRDEKTKYWRVQLRQVSEGQVKWIWSVPIEPKDAVPRVVFSPSSKLLAIVTLFSVSVWRISDGQLLLQWQVISERRQKARFFTFLWRIIPSEISLKGVTWSVVIEEAEVTSAVFSPDEKLLAIGTRDGIVEIWRIPE